MALDISELGFTKEELQERVVDQICETLLSSIEYDPDDGSEYPVASKFQQAIKKRVDGKIAETINALAERYVLPNVAKYIETMTIQATNQYGEKKGEPMTFIEYLVSRAEDYMREKVDFQGKDKSESGGFSWSGTQTRITYLIEKHLHYSIETAMKDALKTATSEIAKGIHETARLKLNEIAAGMKVQVTTK